MRIMHLSRKVVTPRGRLVLHLARGTEQTYRLSSQMALGLICPASPPRKVLHLKEHLCFNIFNNYTSLLFWCLKAFPSKVNLPFLPHLRNNQTRTRSC
ncbi:UNVERIFIED_ASMBLY: hypothetical protein E7W53_10835 [Cronobacter sakazakii]